jgi:Amt family ammonium transporter
VCSWFGFNAGSAFASGSDAVHALFNTHIAACASTVSFLLVQILVHKKKPSAVAMMNGAIAGLAGITPAAGYVSQGAALVLGFILGAAACVSASLIRSRLNVDDALDVSSVHGVTGILGSLYVGLCASNGGL